VTRSTHAHWRPRWPDSRASDAWSRPLRGLDEAATAELIRALAGNIDVSTDVTKFLHERSAGNPFFAEELVQACIEQHVAASSRGSFQLASVRALDVPRSVRATIAQRVDRLPTSARHLVATASVLGAEFDARPLAYLAEMSEALVVQQLAAAVEARLLSEAPEVGAHAYAFRHTLIQETLYTGLAGHRRVQLHRRAAEVLEQCQPHAVAELARHFQAGGNDQRAIHYLREAASYAARRGAYAEAAAHLRTAVSLLEGTTEQAQVAELLMLLGARLERLNREEALEAYKRAFQKFGDLGNQAGQARVQRDIAWLHANRQDFSNALTCFDRAMRLWPADRLDVEYIRFLVDHARVRAFVLDLESAESLARRALELAE
jgi:predicted ATPase